MNDMRCRGCDAIAQESSYGPWCDACGGVMFRAGEPYVRHVATASGAGGDFKILYDHSFRQYSVAVTRNIKTWVELKKDFVQAVRTFIYTGTLDYVIALIQPEARGDAKEYPALLIGAGANDDEKASVAETFDGMDEGAVHHDATRIESLSIDKG